MSRKKGPKSMDYFNRVVLPLARTPEGPLPFGLKKSDVLLFDGEDLERLTFSNLSVRRKKRRRKREQSYPNRKIRLRNTGGGKTQAPIFPIHISGRPLLWFSRQLCPTNISNEGDCKNEIQES